MAVAPHAWVVRPFTREDLPQVVAVEKAVYSDPWTEQLLSQSLDAPMTHTLGVFDMSGVIAYAIYQVIFTEGHLLNIAVSLPFQRQGLGRWLIHKMLSDAHQKGAESCFLEVRPSNTSAIALYEKMGFRPLMVREKYYSNGESAIVMVLDLKDLDLEHS